jgi:mannose-6-phosphate isomerase-like protein (cupin superfamily)
MWLSPPQYGSGMADPVVAVFRNLAECPTEEWNSPTRGSVRWWELFGGDATATSEMTVGVAEVPVGAVPPPRGHRHDANEVYVILSGVGEVVVGGRATAVAAGSAVWIPADAEHFAHNTGHEPLRLLYVFARDRFSDVHYSFPGDE